MRNRAMKLILCFLTIFLLLALSGICTDKNDFPEGFTFGAATSAYQWEGAFDEDGRKPSVWDTFLHSRNRSNGDITCDGYHKYKEDVQLMVETGLDAFRFSISWSRLIPNGRGPVNPKGLQFYKNFIQELVSHGIEPHVTLYHYDHPQYLEDEYGGWINRRIIEDFTAYADVCFREFGHHVKFWTTINEANAVSIAGFNDGNTPPGRCSSPGRNCTSGNSSTEPYIVSHNLLLAHSSASRLYKQKYKDMQGGSVGFSLFALGFAPSTNSKDDDIAVQRAKDFYLGWMLEPLVFGDYPDEMKRTVGSRLPVFSKEESEQVKGSSDFVGIIHYFAALVTNIKPKPSLSRNPDFYSDMGVSVTFLENFSDMKVRVLRLPESDSKLLVFLIQLSLQTHKFSQFIFLSCFVFCLDKYPVTPWAMESVLEDIKQSYGNPPIYILENGTPMKPELQQDTPRIEYLHAYIDAVLKSVRNGSNTRGYFIWSFMDLFELLRGYEFTYGLYYVNFSDPDRKRSPKLSAHWYSAFLKGNTTFLGSQGITQLQSNFSSS